MISSENLAANKCLQRQIMLVFFVVSLRFEDVALVRIGNENGERNSVDELFPNVVYLNGTSGMVSKIEDVNWVVVVSRETGFAPFYLLNLLQSIQARQVVVGRFGCLPTAAVPEDVGDHSSGLALRGDLRHELSGSRDVGVELDIRMLLEERVLQLADERVLHRRVDRQLFRRHSRAGDEQHRNQHQ